MEVLNIMELRRRAGLSQRELASRLGLEADQTISNWETGKREARLTPEQFEKMRESLGCTYEDLIAAFKVLPKKTA